MLQRYTSMIEETRLIMFAKFFNWLRKAFFIFALFLLTDDFNKFINYLARESYVRRSLNLITGTPMNLTIQVFRTGWSEISLRSLDVAFWFILIAMIFSPTLFARMRRMVSYNWEIVVLLALACVSWFWSIAPWDTLNGVYLVMKITLVGIYISQAYSIEEILVFLVWAFALGSVFSILAIWLMPEQSTIFGGEIWLGVYSAKNYLGRLMAFGNAILVIYWLKNDGAIPKRILALELLILTGVLLFFSNSATSLLVLFGMYGAIILYGIWSKWGGRLNTRMLLWPLIILGIVSLILIAWNTKAIFILLNRTPTLTGRTVIWGELWTSLIKRPVFGFGYEAFWHQYPDGILTPFGVIKHAHNGYLEITLALGFPGLIIFIAFLVNLWKRSLLLLSQKRQIIFLWPILALIYLTFANFAYSIAFGFPDFHWALFVIVAGIVTPSQPALTDQPASDQASLPVKIYS